MINEFKGEYRFLSNFFMTDVEFDGEIYPSSEHAYMAAKTTRLDVRWAIKNCASPADAKKMGRTVGLRAGWDNMKYAIMHELLMDKFERNPIIRQKLIDTGDQQLVEGNWWGDKIWGVCLKTGQGQNQLGQALMTVRTHMQLRYGEQKRVIAVIGTAGRDKSIQMSPRHWDFMCNTLADELKPGDTLVSGGAAWADHVAVWAFGTGLVKELTLHLPAEFNNAGFVGDYGSSGNACNYYHELFSRVMGFNSIGHIRQALSHQGVFMSEQPYAKGYAAMATRNRLVADDCTHMVAFTFGEGNIPADGGTKMTWDMAASKERCHVTIPR